MFGFYPNGKFQSIRMVEYMHHLAIFCGKKKLKKTIAVDVQKLSLDATFQFRIYKLIVIISNHI